MYGCCSKFSCLLKKILRIKFSRGLLYTEQPLTLVSLTCKAFWRQNSMLKPQKRVIYYVYRNAHIHNFWIYRVLNGNYNFNLCKTRFAVLADEKMFERNFVCFVSVYLYMYMFLENIYTNVIMNFLNFNKARSKRINLYSVFKYMRQFCIHFRVYWLLVCAVI